MHLMQPAGLAGTTVLLFGVHVAACLAALLPGRLSANTGGPRPHLLYILADDFGWADADWHRPDGWDEAATPNMMKELETGIELDNMYSFKVSPGRYRLVHPRMRGDS